MAFDNKQVRQELELAAKIIENNWSFLGAGFKVIIILLAVHLRVSHSWKLPLRFINGIPERIEE